MASASVVGAVKERYETFTIAATVPMYFGYVPTMTAADTPVNPPYILMEDLGTTPTEDYSGNPVEVTNLALTVYATQLSDVDATASAVRYNGGAVGSGAGLDRSASLPLTGMTLMRCVRRHEQRGATSTPNLTAQRVHFCRMEYEVQVLRTA